MRPAEKIGAFFDLDGTLLAAPSLEWRFIAYLLARDEIGTPNVKPWFAECARNAFRGRWAASVGNKRYLTGIRELVIADWAGSLAAKSLPYLVQGIEQVRWHLGRGHRVFVVSGTLAPLARVIGRDLPGQVEVRATEIDVFDGHFTGHLVSEHLSLEAKARAVREIAIEHDLNLAQSYAYGNQMQDFQMLQTVGNAVAINPSWRLARAARRCGWAIWKWLDRACNESPDLANRVNRALLVPKGAR